MYEIKLYKSKWKAVRLILLTVPFVCFFIWDLIYNTGTKSWTDWAGSLFFGLGIPLGIFNLLDKRPELIINRDGIFNRSSYGILDKDPNREFVSWDSISDAYLRVYQNQFCGLPISKQKFVCLTLKEKSKHDFKAKRYTSKLARHLGLGDYSIPLLHLKKFDEQKFIDLIKLMANANITEKQDLLLNTKL